jgi:tRNA A37 threonylcarbamoyladenosine modification protein TsaB
MRLKIDTSDNRKTSVSLDGATLIKEYQSPQEQDVLAAIDELLKRQGKKLSAITAIEVNQGPGAFTSLRVGVSIAKALQYALGLGSQSHQGGRVGGHEELVAELRCGGS